MSALRMWSTLTSTLFLLPQSAANLSIHSSYAGTKWLQTRILSWLPALAVGSGPAGAAATGLAAGAAPAAGDAAGEAPGEGEAPAAGDAAAAGEAPAAGDAAGAGEAAAGAAGFGGS